MEGRKQNSLAVIGLDFGKAGANSNKLWAQSNEEIAITVCSIMGKLARRGERVSVLIMQKECFLAYYGRCNISAAICRISRNHSNLGKYLDTEEVLRQAHWLMLDKGVRRAVIVAHPSHYNRCVRIAEWLGIHVDHRFRPSLNWIRFDPQSAQPWTRSRWRFFTWTILGYLKFYLARRDKNR